MTTGSIPPPREAVARSDAFVVTLDRVVVRRSRA
jgi:hypothetical protein